MNQEWEVAVLCLNWIASIAHFSGIATQIYWTLALAWLLTLPLAAWAYMRVRPIDGRVLDRSRGPKEPHSVAPTPPEVIIYTALGCPSCPIVKERLITLSRATGFRLKEVDLTLRPGVLVVKGIRALPVVECGTWRVEGNATSEKLANLIAGSRAGQPALAR